MPRASRALTVKVTGVPVGVPVVVVVTENVLAAPGIVAGGVKVAPPIVRGNLPVMLRLAAGFTVSAPMVEAMFGTSIVEVAVQVKGLADAGGTGMALAVVD